MATAQRTRLIHTTDREQYKRCRLQWDFRSPLRRNLTPVRSHQALTFGTAWHAGLATYYGGSRSVEQAKLAIRASLQGWFDSIPNPSEEDEDEYADGLALGLGMMDHYGEFAATVDDFEVLWVEREFVVEIPEVNASYTLQPDAVVQDKHERYWIMEHKSADKLPEQTDYLLMDEQCGSYIWGLQRATGIRAEGVIYNIARKAVPAPLKINKNGHLSLDKRQMTTYEIAHRQVLQHYRTAPSAVEEFLEYLKGRGDRFFFRENVRRNRREIEFLGRMIAIEATEMLNPDIPIYRNPNRFNCSNCAFVGPCIARYEGADYEAMLAGGYKPND